MQIKLILSDFDGTLVDTREANFLAYREVLEEFGYTLTSAKYYAAFGLRFEEFMGDIGITDKNITTLIKERKAKVYPHYFNHLKLNHVLSGLIAKFRETGGKSGLVSTAQRNNIMNVLNHFDIAGLFDIIVPGDEVSAPKPDPGAYLYAINQIGCQPGDTLIFEDSETGIEAARLSGASYIIISNAFFPH